MFASNLIDTPSRVFVSSPAGIVRSSGLALACRWTSVTRLAGASSTVSPHCHR